MRAFIAPCAAGLFGMRSAIGLRHPASASCLGRHLRLAGRCPNNSSLFPPLAAVVVVALCASSAERIFIISEHRSVCGRSGAPFSWEGFRTNSLSQNLTVLPAPSGREPLARPETLHFSWKLFRYAKGPILEGAVAEGDWGSSAASALSPLFFPSITCAYGVVKNFRLSVQTH